MGHEDLRIFARTAGEPYGTEDKAFFLYALVKMQRPLRIVELGTGLGVTSFWLAQAVQENGVGHVWSVDNGGHWARRIQPVLRGERPSDTVFARLQALEPPWLAELFKESDYLKFLNLGAAHFDLSPHVSFVDATVALDEPHADRTLAPAFDEPIDLLFADMGHDPLTALSILAGALPFLSSSASIFIDSSATLLPTYLALVQTIHDLNHGKVPASFARTHRGLRELIATRRFTLVPITETKDRDQNGMVWIKVEPVDIFPYPLTTMRGLPTTRDEVSMGRVDAERLAQRCDEKSRPAPGKD